MISFVLEARIDRGVYGHVFPLLIFYGGMQANGIIHEGGVDRCCRRKSDCDGFIIFIILIYVWSVSFERMTSE